jgi:hypothetical protein
MIRENRSNAITRRDVLKGATVASGALVSREMIGTVRATSGGGPGGGPCDLVVPDDYPTIQMAVDAADAGERICVRPGTYDEAVEIATPVTLKGRTAPHSDRPAHVDGRISVGSGGDGSRIARLRIAPTETFTGGTFPDPFGVRVTTGDVVVEHNLIEDFTADLSDGNGSLSLNGVQVFGADEAGISDVTVRGNVVRGFRNEGVPSVWPKFGGIAGVKVQANVERATVGDNVIVDHHSAGWVWGVVLATSGSAPGVPSDVTVENNHLAGLNDGSEYEVFTGPNEGRNAAPYPGSGFGIDGDADAKEATVRNNNLLAPNGAETKDGDGTLVAECNWWGSESGPTDDDNSGGTGSWALERGTASIDYTPWLVAPAPSNACVGR